MEPNKKTNADNMIDVWWLGHDTRNVMSGIGKINAWLKGIVLNWLLQAYKSKGISHDAVELLRREVIISIHK